MSLRRLHAIVSRPLVLAAAALAAGAAVPAALAAAPPSAPPSAEADVRDQLFKLQKDTARLLDRIDQLEQKLGARGGEQNACAEAAARTASLEQHLRVIEEQLLATQKRLDDTLVELRAQRRAPTGPSPAGLSVPGVPSGSPPAGLPAATSPAGPSSGTAPAASPSAAPLPGGDPEDLFNGAYADYSRGNYDMALAGFEAALKVDPQGPLADDAQYYVGETLYARGQFTDAAAAYDRVIAGWPGGDKLPAATLKKGFALYEGKRTAEGVMTLQRVIEAWPGSDQARLARDFLRRKGVVAD